MIRPVDPNKMNAALRLLGLEQTWQQLMGLRPQSAEEAGAFLAAWKDKALKPSYRELARKYHPDQHPDDAVAEQKMKEVSEAFNLLRELTLTNRPRGIRGGPTGAARRPVRRRVVVIHMDIRGGAVRAETSATNTVTVDIGNAGTDSGTGNI